MGSRNSKNRVQETAQASGIDSATLIKVAALLGAGFVWELEL